MIAERPAAGQQWSAARYARYGRFVADLAQDLVAILDAKPGERILDLGCGDGALSEQIAARGATVLGVDASAEMVAAARARGLDVRLLDGHALAAQADLRESFDAVFSNAALHWMKRDPDAVLQGMASVLKPAGRLVAELGAAGNVASLRGALHEALAARGISACAADPWYFPSAADYRQRLEQAGFEVVAISSFERPTPLTGSAAHWLQTFAGAFLEAVPGGQRETLVAEVQARLAQRPRRAGEQWVADYVRLRFTATKRNPHA